MSDTLRRILLVALFTIGIAALVYLVYVVFFQQPATTTPDGTTGTTTQPLIGLPGIQDAIQPGSTDTTQEEEQQDAAEIPGVDAFASGGLTAATTLTPDANVISPAPATDNTVRYYDSFENQFYKVNENGSITQLGTASFPDVEQVTWADRTNEAILEFPDGSNVYYNLDTNRQVTLPKEYKDFDFSDDGSQIAFKYMHSDEERRVLAVSSPDGSQARTIEALGENEHRVNVEWSPTGRVVATVAQFIDANRQEVGFVGLRGENFKGTVVQGRGLQSLYSNDGQQLLYSVYSAETDYQPTMWIVDADGERIGNNRTDLNLRTFADKCAYAPDENVAYCGVPSQQVYGYGLSPELLDSVTDDIYKIDLTSGTKTKIATPVNQNGEVDYSVDNKTMSVINNGSTLVFRDAQSKELISIDLP